MPVYKITDPESGRTIQLKGEKPPSKEQIQEAFASLPPKVMPEFDDGMGAIPPQGVPPQGGSRRSRPGQRRAAAACAHCRSSPANTPPIAAAD